ncbi:MAG: tRNA-(ms[2]io[6]A)-hydroxylase [Cytophagales bacterium]
MLGLQMPTDPRWVNIVEKSVEEILVDHAWCEQKAASSCISLIVQYPHFAELVEVLSPVVIEEWNHFELVLAELKKRGLKLGAPRHDIYVNQLMETRKKGGDLESQLVEKLLIMAIIEARSCERFRLLSLNISDNGLKSFYHDLMVSEASHYMNFVKLAKKFKPDDYVENRLDELMRKEAQILKNIEYDSNRIHGKDCE